MTDDPEPEDTHPEVTLPEVTLPNSTGSRFVGPKGSMKVVKKAQPKAPHHREVKAKE